jgi:hypothetical protein
VIGVDLACPTLRCEFDNGVKGPKWGDGPATFESLRTPLQRGQVLSEYRAGDVGISPCRDHL